MNRFFKITAVILSALFFHCGAASAMSGEPIVTLRFADDTRFYKIPSSDILSELTAEKLIASGKFVLRETRPIDTAEFSDGTGRDEAYSVAVRRAARKYGANFAVTGRIKRIEAVHRVFRDIGNAASTAGTVADILSGGILGTVIGAFGGASTTSDVLAVVADFSIIDAADGRTVWEKELAAAVKVGKYPGAPKTTASGITADESFVNVMDSLAESAVKAMIEEVGLNRLIVK